MSHPCTGHRRHSETLTADFQALEKRLTPNPVWMLPHGGGISSISFATADVQALNHVIRLLPHIATVATTVMLVGGRQKGRDGWRDKGRT